MSDDEHGGFYEDDGEFLDGEGELDLPTRQQLRNRIVAAFSTSYGLSVAAHAAVLVILATIVIAGPAPSQAAVLVVSSPSPPRDQDEPLERDMRDTPQLEAEEEVERPIIVHQPEAEPTLEVPRGTDLTNLTDTNLDARSIDASHGIGGAPAGAYGHRAGVGALLAREGGTPGTQDAVDAALRWLATHRSPHGPWEAAGWARNCSRGPRCSGPGFNQGGTSYDAGVTSLALLAFLGNGHTHRVGHFAPTVRGGLDWLRRQQRPDGSIGFSASGHGEEIYNHALATLALCEAYAVSRDFTLRRAAEAAVRFCLDAQNPGLGWKYGVKSGLNDTSVTGWMVLALKAARTAGLEVPDAAFEGAQAWFIRATDSSGAVGYGGPGEGSSYLTQNDGQFDPVPCMTAVSVLCRVFSGERRSEDSLRRGARILMDHLPDGSSDHRKVNFYYWYYGTYAMFQVGGDRWRAWNEAMKTALLPTQRKGDCEDGSWDPVGEWCLVGGRVYATALNALTLEIYYRHERAAAH